MCRRTLTVLFVVALLTAFVTGAASAQDDPALPPSNSGLLAQDSAPPDLGSGWELRLEQPMDGWSTVAGSANTGFLVRASGIALWSADGLKWLEVTGAAATSPVFDLAANDRGFVAAKGDKLPNSSVLVSADGQTWESVPVGTWADFWRVESGPAGFLLVSGCDSAVSFSTDGRDWVPADIPPECGSFRAAQTNDGWVAVTSQAEEVVVLSSSDGINWSEVEAQPPLPQLPPPTSWMGYAGSLRDLSLSSDGDTLVLAGKGIGGRLWVSNDQGATWAETGTASGEVEMAVSDFGFVGVAPQRVLVSSDGIAWVEHRVDVGFHDVAAVGNTVVATADDGIYTWTAPEGTLPLTGTETKSSLAVASALITSGIIALMASWHLSHRAGTLRHN